MTPTATRRLGALIVLASLVVAGVVVALALPFRPSEAPSTIVTSADGGQPRVDADLATITGRASSSPSASASSRPIFERDPNDACSARVSTSPTDNELAGVVVPFVGVAGGWVARRVLQDAGGEYEVSDCRGQVVRTDGFVDDPQPTSGPARTGRILVRVWPIAGGDGPRDLTADASYLVRVVVGSRRGICDGPRGFLGVVHRTGDRLRVASTGSFEAAGCSEPDVRFVRIAGTPGFLVSDNNSGDEGLGRGGDDVFLARGNVLKNVGFLARSYDEWSRETFHVPSRNMTSEVREDAAGVAVEETWTLQRNDDSGAHTTTKRRVVYALRNDALVASATEPPL